MLQQDNKVRRIEMKKILRVIICFSLAIMLMGTSIFAATASTQEMSKNKVVFADEIVNGVLPTYIDGDKINVSEYLNPVTRDGGGMKYISTEYARNKTIGYIFDWTSASSVTKSSGWNVSGSVSFKAYGINMTANAGWNTSISRTWTMDKGYRQFRVAAKGDIKIDKYVNQKTNTDHYVKTTINQTDMKEQRK